MLAAEHRKLVAQHQNLNLLGLCRPTAEQDQLEAAAQRQVDERPNHTDLRQGRRARADEAVSLADPVAGRAEKGSSDLSLSHRRGSFTERPPALWRSRAR